MESIRKVAEWRHLLGNKMGLARAKIGTGGTQAEIIQALLVSHLSSLAKFSFENCPCTLERVEF